jgi:2-oxoglutarate ferredoxin oxidoreductase subunit alpha
MLTDTPLAPPTTKNIEELETAVVRFAGDSGDGIQTSGDQFTSTSALMGEDVSTLPDYPSEIRAPSGTVYGVSGFQLCFGSDEIFTPGDLVDTLIVMNPAALKSNLPTLRDNGNLIVNEDAFGPKDLEKAGYAQNPLDGHDLERYRTFRVHLSKLTQNALQGLPLTAKQIDQTKNFFALGLTYWLYRRATATTREWIQRKFGKKPEVAEANLRALQTGWDYGETSEAFSTTYIIRKTARAKKPGTYRYVTGNTAMALGFMAAAQRSGLKLFLGSYPITPATDIMHELAKHPKFATVFQAEDEIAAIGAAIGASYGGNLAITTTSGPGLSLKSEFMNLAVIAELPLVIVDVQRAGPSTGLPTKSEQSDLNQALYGRHGESPVVVLAARSPRDCFDLAVEASRIAIKYMTPVIVLSDGYLGNGAEVWRVPALDELPKMKAVLRVDPEGFAPYERDPQTLARPWAVPGTKGLEHRIGGLEKENGSGAVSHAPANHQKMVELRAAKVAAVANEIPPTQVEGNRQGDLLIISWGSTYGPIEQAVRKLVDEGLPIAFVHLRNLNPLPRDLGDIIQSFPQAVVFENNLGQLWHLLRAEYLHYAERVNKVQGVPFRAFEIETKIRQLLGGEK